MVEVERGWWVSYRRESNNPCTWNGFARTLPLRPPLIKQFLGRTGLRVRVRVRVRARARARARARVRVRVSMRVNFVTI